ncbi:MAG: 16S rRNA (uracil(1498)-N(3))-methyltransferase [Bacillaceae bacterium]
MQRYFIEASQIEGNNIRLYGEDAHHINRVMRMKCGDIIQCCCEGKTATCEIAEITNDFISTIVVEWVEENNELPIQITIASGLPKGDKLELIMQKGTELGATSFLPFVASRSIVKWDEKKGSKKVERWQKITKEAAEQSYRNVVPTVEKPLSFKQLLERSKLYDVCIVAYEEDAKQGEKKMFVSALESVKEGGSLLAVFGPEGGLSETEVSMLKENGFLSCSLGPRILRTETAPLYVLSCASYYFELMR